MINFEEVLRELLKERLNVKVSSVTKTVNNGENKRCLIINENSDCFPTIYIDTLYEMYKKGTSIDKIVDSIVCFVKKFEAEALHTKNLVKDIANFESVKNKIIYAVVNKEKNAVMLSSIPHVTVASDLALIYKICIEIKGREIKTMTITNEMVKNWGTSLTEIVSLADINTPKLLPLEIISLDDIFPFPLPSSIPMMVVTNKNNINGAGSVFYDGVLEKLSEKMGNLIIIPSSVHECIVMPEDSQNDTDLVDVIREVNSAELSAEEILSDHPYRYIKNEKCVIAA